MTIKNSPQENEAISKKKKKPTIGDQRKEAEKTIKGWEQRTEKSNLLKASQNDFKSFIKSVLENSPKFIILEKTYQGLLQYIIIKDKKGNIITFPTLKNHNKDTKSDKETGSVDLHQVLYKSPTKTPKTKSKEDEKAS